MRSFTQVGMWGGLEKAAGAERACEKPANEAKSEGRRDAEGQSYGMLAQFEARIPSFSVSTHITTNSRKRKET